ncbi:DUF3667 domain-containing protein [Dokdonia sp.]|uniref:DUF3667 domain-containing protein n=1 Tax=Dokdonia sp. TaxID=2024995 RepID=UPI0032678E45
MAQDAKSIVCKNCKTQISGNFCMHCGQSIKVTKITVRDTLQDFVNSIFSVNAPLLITFKLLFLNPGKLFREFLDGKRKTYYKPVPFFILATILLVLIRSVINYDPFQEVTSNGIDNPSFERIITTAKFMSKNINNFLLLFVLTLSLTLKLFFRKSYTLAEYLAISFYIVGIYTLFATISLFLTKFISNKLQYFSFIIMVIYLIYACNSLFLKKRVIVTLKTLIMYSLAMFLYIILGFGLSFLILSLKN